LPLSAQKGLTNPAKPFECNSIHKVFFCHVDGDSTVCHGRYDLAQLLRLSSTVFSYAIYHSQAPNFRKFVIAQI